ncbi:galactoside alpha-(1,2)-fucosyltransferase 1-like isoform X2 [Mytilus edulis]|uniref:galactoside alpha-(1,2)-fucosyltransferase 1-like isoform X2 n=1 Tax=Mytilus edulis TaxID=6550 RepID=UPI0039F09C25
MDQAILHILLDYNGEKKVHHQLKQAPIIVCFGQFLHIMLQRTNSGPLVGIVIPCLTCAFVLIFFVFQTDVNKFPIFEVFNDQIKNGSITKRNWTKNHSVIFKGKNIKPLTQKVRYESTTKTLLKQTKFTTKGMKISTITPAIIAVRNNSNNNTHFVCPVFMGGFGNTMFQLAAHFGVAMSKGMRVIVANNSELNRVFKLEDIDIRHNTDICKTFISRGERQNCAYDKNLLKFNSFQNIRLGQYLQSWKYFYDFRSQLKKQFTFRDHLLQEAKSKIVQTVKRFNRGSTRDVTLVGVHVRRGDMVNHKFGYNIATPEYLTKAVQYFQSKYKNVVFIISSQDIPWTKANMPNNTNVEYLTSPKREIIVATLTLCNHTITTVGSFSWWIGWLTGGEVTYFKWPAKEGSALRKQYSKDFSDFYYPGWIGM